ncbi:MAG: tetratricopeptide repeat protein [Pyrinomonadaceae bacterium]
MKNNCLTAIALIFLCLAHIEGQKPNSAEEKKALTDKSFALFQQGKLNDAIELAAKVVELEKKSPKSDSASLVNATMNLARFKRDNYLRLRAKAADRGSPPKIRNQNQKEANKNAGEAEELYREALTLNESDGRSVSAQTADIKSDLAWLVHNFYPVRDTTLVDRPSTRSRIDEAESLYTASLALNEQTRGKDADETLLITLASGNFYLIYDNYEKALPFYERHIQTVDKKHGANHAELANALRPYAQMLFAIFQEQEAMAL